MATESAASSKNSGTSHRMDGRTDTRARTMKSAMTTMLSPKLIRAEAPTDTTTT